MLALGLALTATGSLLRSPMLAGVSAQGSADWPQHGYDAARSGASPHEVPPPYCEVWKWYEAPIARRAQPVVAGGRLYVGDMHGTLHAREVANGAPAWQFRTAGPIRHTPAVAGSRVIVSSHDGSTSAVATQSGALVWQRQVGPSATAPLVDHAANRVVVATTTGRVVALDIATGHELWSTTLDAAVLTSPALSTDHRLVLVGTERVDAVALDADSGAVRWRTPLVGQSLQDTHPVVVGHHVYYRSQPIDHFHHLLHEGDDVLDAAGPVAPDWTADWAVVRPRVLAHLDATPRAQSLFVIDLRTGERLPPLPVLYTYGNNDTPAAPVASALGVFLPYRARHGIQTDSPVAVHVTTRYDAEVGRLDATARDVTGIPAAAGHTFSYQFRLTSDEPAELTMSGRFLLIDNWERLGGLDVSTGQLFHVAAVSNTWPECWVECGVGSDRPFFPMRPGEPAYPFPSPRVTEGHRRPGAVVANGLVFWRVIEGGLAAYRTGTACPAPTVWATAPGAPAAPVRLRVEHAIEPGRPFADYASLPSAPAAAPPADLVARLRAEVATVVGTTEPLLPAFIQRGFSNPQLWPHATTNPPGPPAAAYRSEGNLLWHDPAELLATLAGAYPYLDATAQAATRAFVGAHLVRVSPLDPLPFGDRSWLLEGRRREAYDVPFRDQINVWPPPGVALSNLHAIWLWAARSGDWSFVDANWSRIVALHQARSSQVRYYADLSGLVAFVRMAAHLGRESERTAGEAALAAAMNAGLDFEAFRRRAEQEYPDPRGQTTGWSMPVFFGLTREVGLYLREHVGRTALDYVLDRTTGDGMRWWYLTRAGAHAEIGETSFLHPQSAWSHFMAQAYLARLPQDGLARYLDRPFMTGDLHSIQRLVATIEADP